VVRVSSLRYRISRSLAKPLSLGEAIEVGGLFSGLSYDIQRVSYVWRRVGCACDIRLDRSFDSLGRVVGTGHDGRIDLFIYNRRYIGKHRAARDCRNKERCTLTVFMNVADNLDEREGGGVPLLSRFWPT
jgi:hypothetical protein